MKDALRLLVALLTGSLVVGFGLSVGVAIARNLIPSRWWPFLVNIEIRLKHDCDGGGDEGEGEPEEETKVDAPIPPKDTNRMVMS